MSIYKPNAFAHLVGLGMSGTFTLIALGFLVSKKPALEARIVTTCIMMPFALVTFALYLTSLVNRYEVTGEDLRLLGACVRPFTRG